MSPQGYNRRQDLRGQSRGVRAWGDAHPAAMAALQGVLFGILFGIVMAVTSAHRSIGSDVVRAAIAGVIFALAMWAVVAFRRRTPTRGWAHIAIATSRVWVIDAKR